MKSFRFLFCLGAAQVAYLVLIGLKAFGFVSWPWLYVLAPVWLPLAVSFGGLICVLLIFGLIALFRFSKTKIEPIE